jgi:TDG/mug DNA glycosylase family protein
MSKYKPTKRDLVEARSRTTDDLIDHGLSILFCGINAGLYSAATGFHFARPGNRFWKALHQSGLTERQLDPSEEHELLELGFGITGFCRRATASASELTKQEIIAGGERLVKRVEKYKPRILAVLAMTAYRTAFSGARFATGEYRPDAHLAFAKPKRLERKLSASRFCTALYRAQGFRAHDALILGHEDLS